MQTNQLHLLDTRRFLPLFLTQFLGAFNDNVFKNALVVLITYRLADAYGLNAQKLVTLAAGIFILPFFLFSATAGQLADKYERSRLIVWIKVAEIILMILAVIALYLQSVWLLMTVLFFLGVQATFFGPLKYAILPEHLQENELIAGNGLIEAGTFLAILLGTVLGGMLILHSMGVLLISVMIVLWAICGWASSLFIPKTTQYSPDLKIGYNFIAETWRVITYSKQHNDLFLCILAISWFWLVGATFLAEFPVFAKDTLHANENVVTYFFTIFSVGIGLGSLLCNRLLKGEVHATYVPLGALGMSIFITDMYFATAHLQPIVNQPLVSLTGFLSTFHGWRITVDLLLMAVCGGIYTVPLYAMLQKRSEEAHRARVIASNNIINALFMVVAALATLLMLDMGLSVSGVFLVVAMVNAVVAVYICKLLPDALVKAILKTILKTCYRVHIEGLEHYQEAGKRVVIVANHTSYLDAALLAAFLPHKLNFAVNTEVAKRRWIRFFMKLVRTYPLDPTNPMALKSLIEFVRTDKRCVIFPEGRLTMTGALMKIYEGPGLVADKAEANLLPIRIQGAQFTPFSRLKGKMHIRWFPKITLTVFPPVKFALPQNMSGRQRRQYIGAKLYDLMTEVMFDSSPYHQTLFHSLLDAEATHGQHHIIMEDIERKPITYQTFIMRSFILGKKIARFTQSRQHVGVLLPNAISTAVTFFALQAFSRVPAMLNFSTGIQNAVTACRTANISHVVTARRFIDTANLIDMVMALEHIGVKVHYLEDIRASLTVEDKIAGVCMKWFPRWAYAYYNRKKRVTDYSNPHMPAVILFTSGSEGTPKGVVLSHRNIQANRFQLSARIDFIDNDIVFNVLPLFHSFGLTGGLLLPLLAGFKIFLYPSPLHYRIIPELIYDVNATVLFGTDTFLANYAKYAHPYDFYSIRYVFAGAEKLREETRQFWAQKLGVRIFEGYGATETSPILATNTPMQNKLGTVGRLMPGIRYELKPIEGIAEGGELVVAGPNIMLGYLLANNPGVIVPPAQGWYETGDIVSIDAGGYVTILGRSKRFAKIAGEMVSLTRVEQAINALWPEFQHAVVSVPDAKKGEQLVLVTTHKAASREALIEHAKKQQLGELSIPRKLVVVEKLPLLGTGKIDYVSIKALVMDTP